MADVAAAGIRLAASSFASRSQARLVLAALHELGGSRDAGVLVGGVERWALLQEPVAAVDHGFGSALCAPGSCAHLLQALKRLQEETPIDQARAPSTQPVAEPSTEAAGSSKALAAPGNSQLGADEAVAPDLTQRVLVSSPKRQVLGAGVAAAGSDSMATMYDQAGQQLGNSTVPALALMEASLRAQVSQQQGAADSSLSLPELAQALAVALATVQRTLLDPSTLPG